MELLRAVIPLVFHDVTFILLKYALLNCQYILQIIGIQISLHRMRHTANYKIQAKSLHQTAMYKPIYRNFILPTLAKLRYDMICHTYGMIELFNIQRIHFLHIHISYWFRTKIIKLHPQERAAQDITIAPLIYQKLDKGYHFWVYLNFIKEYQSLALYKRFVHKSRQAKEYILYIFGTVEYAYSLWRSNEVDFYEIIKITLSRFSYGIGFTYLSSSCYKQSFLDVLEKIA